MQRAPVLLVLIFMFAACERGDSSGRAGEIINPVPAVGGFILPQPEVAPQAARTQADVDRKIIRAGELDLLVDDVDAVRRDVAGRVTAAGGYLAADRRDEYGRMFRLRLDVRVPADRFEAFAEATRALGSVEHYDIEAADVSEEWVDVEARLTVLREMKKRYLDLIARATDVPEVLVVQREVSRVQSDIESMAAKMRSLRARVAMSTLKITCRSPMPAGRSEAPLFTAAFASGWDGFVRLLVGIVHVWPIVFLILPVAGWGFTRRWRSRRG